MMSKLFYFSACRFPNSIRSLTAFALGMMVVGTQCLLTTSPVCADLITNIEVDNQSSPPPTTGLRDFQTLSTLSGVTISGNTASFTHRMAVRNWHQGLGGVAQTNKGNVIYQLDFTVNDPMNLGFQVDLENLIRGISTLDITSNPGNGGSMSTGLHLGAYLGTSIGDPFLAGISGSTDGTGSQLSGQHALYDEFFGGHSLGSFQGTTDFSLYLTSLPTPTTNVVFANNATGTGEVIYGLGTIPVGFEQYNINDLGHFLTVNVTFTAIPEPGSIGLFAVALTSLIIRRRYR